jgi:hypothetical protein
MSIDQATNLMQTARGALDNAVSQLNDKPAFQALIAASFKGDSDEKDFWPEVGDRWSRATDLLESRVQSITDGRRLRKYSIVPRHTYFRVIQLLRQDGPEFGGFTADEAEAAHTMHSHFLTHRTRKMPVGRIEREEFNALSKVLGVPVTSQTTRVLQFGPLIFMICVLGGLGNMIGGCVTAFIISQFIAVGSSCFHTEWGYAVAFLFFIVANFFKPQGLFGAKT